MFPALQRGQNRQVLALQFVVTGLELISQRTAVDEHRLLAFADNELRAVLDLILIAGEAPCQCRAGIIDPLDDVNEFALEFVEKTHVRPAFHLSVRFAAHHR